jgi:hypothetical protein
MKHDNKDVISFDYFKPEQLIIEIIEAENIESVRDFAIELGLMAWNKLKLNPLTSLLDLWITWTRHCLQIYLADSSASLIISACLRFVSKH